MFFAVRSKISNSRASSEAPMMNSQFSEFLRARVGDRRDVFLGAARSLGTPEAKA